MAAGDGIEIGVDVMPDAYYQHLDALAIYAVQCGASAAAKAAYVNSLENCPQGNRFVVSIILIEGTMGE